MRKRIALLILALLAGPLLGMGLAVPSPALAKEAITEFASHVIMKSDGSQVVREKIVFTAEGNNIKRGLFRDFPRAYAGPEQYQGDVPFKVLSVHLDGREIKPSVQHKTDFFRVMMAGKDLLSHGEHSLVLIYETSMHMRPFENYDELNWNVTGTWAFKICRYSCVIELPKNVPVMQTIAWAGPTGSRNSYGIIVDQPEANEVLFTGPQACLNPGEQFTVAVNFPKKLIADPVAKLLQERTRKEEEAIAKGSWHLLIFRNPMLPMQFLGMLLLGVYFMICWLLVGKDPAKGTIIPRFYPPQGIWLGKGEQPGDFVTAPLSPLAVEYLVKAGSTSGKGLAALCVDLAVKDLCAISKEPDDKYVLRPRLPEADLGGRADMAKEEKLVYSALVKSSPEGKLSLSSHMSTMREINQTANNTVSWANKKSWSSNAWFNLIGLLLVLPLALCIGFWDADIGGYFSTGDIPKQANVLLACALMVWFLSLSFLLILNGEVLPGIISLPFPGAGVFRMTQGGFFDTPYWVIPLLMLCVAVFFVYIMKAPSKKAKGLLDEIDGLRMYIKAAEEERLKMIDSPEDTPEVFQRLLPYAMVFGLDQEWCDRFAEQIASDAMVMKGIDKNFISSRSTRKGFSSEFSSYVASSVAYSTSSTSSAASRSAFGGGGGRGGGGSGSGSGGGGGGGI
jgi:uncharacterized membrane protein YgcG